MRQLHVKQFVSCIHVYEISARLILLNVVNYGSPVLGSHLASFFFFFLLKISQNLCCGIGSVLACIERLQMRIRHKRMKAQGDGIIFGHNVLAVT